ncbi:MAG TPA: sigma-70 family RNA polymerase sigma factor [Candidatus Anaerofilum faecale]|nr:sigma-70 family RNA polymerase sigma factor [Candidatus Anaerofilum faecale]
MHQKAETRQRETTGAQAPQAPQQPTNEQLAALAKDGDRQALAALWAQNKGLLYILCRRYASRFAWRAAAAGVTWEDIQQEGYFMICTAVRLYDPARGAQFASLLPYIVRNHLQELLGIRTQRARNDPLSKAASLDEPLDAEDEAGATRADLVPDPAAVAAFESAEQALFIRKLRADLERSLARLDPRQADALRGKYYMGYTLQQLAESMGVSQERARQLQAKGLAAMRRCVRELRPYLDEIRTIHAYRGTGFGAWKNGGSVEERTAERLEREQRQFAHSAAQELAKTLEDARQEKGG